MELELRRMQDGHARKPTAVVRAGWPTPRRGVPARDEQLLAAGGAVRRDQIEMAVAGEDDLGETAASSRSVVGSTARSVAQPVELVVLNVQIA